MRNKRFVWLGLAGGLLLAVLIVVWWGSALFFHPARMTPDQPQLAANEEAPSEEEPTEQMPVEETTPPAEEEIPASDDDEAPEEPVPFEEMTIPYLQQRSYNSQLAPLTQYRQQGAYTSFLTSYLSDDLRIEALLTQPSGEMPEEGWPAVVFIHGYIPPSLYRTTERYEAFVDYLAKSGLVVLKIDLRGHGNSEGEASGAYYSSDYIIDVLHARAALQQADFVDPDKIGLWGHSMAGNVVLRSMAAQPEIPAAVIMAGAVYSYEDLQRYGLDDNSYRPPSSDSDRVRRRSELLETHGAFQPDSAFWQQVAPTNYLLELEGAIQLHHAIDDSVVNIGYSRDVGDLLTQAAVTHQVHEYPSGGHNMQGSSFGQSMQRTVDFFDEYLGRN